jgi:hypothetical protein
MVYGGWDDAKVVLPDEVLELRASSQGGGGADLTPLGEALTPRKTRTPLLTPLVFHQLEVPLTFGGAFRREASLRARMLQSSIGGLKINTTGCR